MGSPPVLLMHREKDNVCYKIELKFIVMVGMHVVRFINAKFTTANLKKKNKVKETFTNSSFILLRQRINTFKEIIHEKRFYM